MNVYWTAITPMDSFSAINFLDPEPSIKFINDREMGNNDVKFCPAVKLQQKNCYSLKFPVDYDLHFEGDRFYSTMYDQEFFDKYIMMRDPVSRLITMRIYYLFIAEESLEIESTGAYVADNEFVNKAIMVPGRFDIGKWYRPLDCAFFVKKGVNSMEMKRGEIYSTVKFLTDKPVKLKKFEATDKLVKLIEHNVNSRNYKCKMAETLSYYYGMLEQSRFKKAILKEVKNNLLD